MHKRKVLVTEKIYPHGYAKPVLIKEIGIGEFHSWGCCYEEFEAGPGNYSTAIVEMQDGSIITPYPTDIKFLKLEDEKDYDLLEIVLDAFDPLLTACIKANQYLAYLASEGKLNDQNEVDNWSGIQQILTKAIKEAKGY